MAPTNFENKNYKLNQDKYDHDIHYIFRYETTKEDNSTSTRALNFIPIFFEFFDNPLDEFIRLSNKVFETLYPKQENSRNNDNVKRIKEITYVVRDMEGVAYTTNDFEANTAEIHLSLEYIFDYFKDRAKHFHSHSHDSQDSNQRNSNATVTKTVLDNPESQTITTVITTTVVTTIVSKKSLPNITEEKEAMDETLYEIRGVLSHELVHVWQFSCDGLPPNLIEGIADAVRLAVGYPAKHWVERSVPTDGPNAKRTPWARGYDGACFFFNWIQNNVANTDEFKDLPFIAALNKQCRYRYTDKAIKFITGHNVEDLFTYYQISLNDK
ncbi:BSP-domain-containing protein [Anaeromyces robustus]|uniref:BSP-domain-containing protein n=1 Tax=Anaeromyces robustus TaxID=1754192 RepID=A0A1Y1X5X6_9FUNG|nr:BSP-domain-containing protein [Anaeromyces robustus]|eukprot:ORX81055.1 BSP-domain-containing protein [Anaeromyces robustus]